MISDIKNPPEKGVIELRLMLSFWLYAVDLVSIFSIQSELLETEWHSLWVSHFLWLGQTCYCEGFEACKCHAALELKWHAIAYLCLRCGSALQVHEEEGCWLHWQFRAIVHQSCFGSDGRLRLLEWSRAWKFPKLSWGCWLLKQALRRGHFFLPLWRHLGHICYVNDL